MFRVTSNMLDTFTYTGIPLDPVGGCLIQPVFNSRVTKADVGLGDVDNTSDLNKPLSTASTTALALKANLTGPTTFTGLTTTANLTATGTVTIPNGLVDCKDQWTADRA